ncbi:PTS fructose transporter subunit IIABC [Peptostreptococcus equinus]|uniref:Fructose-specific PTS transporter subunit EIIC n=1 Tax=Peptostreptococcus equinus TaxID=3003601 RepID=A0ABY7JPH8_9FIRM|nr:fructose-specific PTS transporter subunit EIIC [Peptostreptococcus sp. CBA3647]WAW14796.1 fructose-specific PTS transporter subunit EIIC [Peptostreptococcus sp. CBA3647]
MKLSELILKEAMDLSLQTSEKNETLYHLANNFAKTGLLTNVDSYVEKLKAREAEFTTGVGDEIAIPHAQDASIKKPAIIMGRSDKGIDWNSFDGQPAKLLFMIAAPEGGGEHLKALASLSKVLLIPEAKAELLAASNADQVVDIFDKYDESEGSKINSNNESKEEVIDKEINNSTSTPSPIIAEDKPYILAVTACPTGIAHTFMAEEKLKQAAKLAGYPIKVETNGQSGVGNRLTKTDIDKATAIIVAADKQVEMARFNGKPVIITKVSDGINKADNLVERASKADAPIYHAENTDDDNSEDIENESLGRKFYKHLMNGVSHMLPFVVAGGILIAISFFWGINSSNPEDPSYNAIAQTLMVLGKLSFAMMLPILAGFIGKSIADRPGLVIGLMGGIFANPGIIADFGGGVGIFKGAVPSGFLGALIAGFLAGGIVWFLRKITNWMPKSLDGLKPIFIFPVLGVLIMGILMLFVINGPMGAIMSSLTGAISSIPREWTIILGFVVGAMMSIDMGGPINKAAYVTGTALVTAGGAAGSNVMAAVMVGGMVPPLAIAIAATIKKNLWPAEQRNSALVNYVMGAAFITEGAIPFAAANPLKVIPSLAFGAGVAGALSMLFKCYSLVPHGGIFAVAAGGVTNPLMFLLAWLIGGLVGAGLLIVTLSRKNIK